MFLYSVKETPEIWETVLYREATLSGVSPREADVSVARVPPT